MNAKFYGFKKFCEIYDECNLLEYYSVTRVNTILEESVKEIKSEVLDDLLKIDNLKVDFYLDKKINIIQNLDYIKNYSTDNFSFFLKKYNITIEDLFNRNYSVEIQNIIDITLTKSGHFIDNYTFKHSTQNKLLHYFLSFHANSLIEFLNSKKLASNNKKSKMKKEYTSISFNIKGIESFEQFKVQQKNSEIFNQALKENPDFLNQLFQLIRSKNRKFHSQYHIFDKVLNMYLIKGFPLFFMREAKGSVALYPVESKIKYLELIKQRKSNLWWRDIADMEKVRGELRSFEDEFCNEFYNHFKQFGVTLNQASVYSRSLIYVANKIKNCAYSYFKNLDENQILGLNDNKFELVKSETSESFSKFHNLIAYIDIKSTPHDKLKAIKFLKFYFENLNNGLFKRTYLYPVIEEEINKLYNNDIIEQIKLENQLEANHLLISENESDQSKAKVEGSSSNGIFEDDESLGLYNRLIENFNISKEDINKRGNQAKLKAIWEIADSKTIIFKRYTELSDYVDYLNNRFGTNFKSRSMSDGHNHHAAIKEWLEEM